MVVVDILHRTPVHPWRQPFGEGNSAAHQEYSALIEGSSAPGSGLAFPPGIGSPNHPAWTSHRPGLDLPPTRVGYPVSRESGLPLRPGSGLQSRLDQVPRPAWDPESRRRYWASRHATIGPLVASESTRPSQRYRGSPRAGGADASHQVVGVHLAQGSPRAGSGLRRPSRRCSSSRDLQSRGERPRSGRDQAR